MVSTKGRFLARMVVVGTIGGSLFGQSKTGTTMGQFLKIEPSARSAAMGGAGAATSVEAMSGYYNPGVLGALLRSDIQFTYNQWYAGITLNSASGAFRIGKLGTAAFSVTQMSSGDIDVRTVEQPLGTGERYSVTDLALGLGYGLRVTDRFSFGLQVNYVSERIWHSSVSVFALSLGTLYQISEDGLKLGASLVNFGTKNRFLGTDLKIRYDFDPTRYGDNSSIPSEITTDEFSLPIVFRVGCSYPIVSGESGGLVLLVDALHPSDNSESVSFGAEWMINNLVAMRGGYQNLFQEDSEVGLTLGAGVIAEALGYDLRFDYGWARHNRLGGIQRITLSFGF